jgi:hypothetical protein
VDLGQLYRLPSDQGCSSRNAQTRRPAVSAAVAATRIVCSWLSRSSLIRRRGSGSTAPRTSRSPYNPANLPAAPPAGYGLTVGAKNVERSAGSQTAPTFPGTGPTQDLRVTSTPGAPGGTFTYSFEVKGTAAGPGTVQTDLTTPLVRGTTIELDTIQVAE